MQKQTTDLARYRADIRDKQREATRLCIELGLHGSEADDPRRLEEIKSRLDRAVVALSAA